MRSEDVSNANTSRESTESILNLGIHTLASVYGSCNMLPYYHLC